MPLDVWRARTVVEAPEPRVMEEPGASVWPEIMYWDCAFGVMVWSFIVITAGPLGLVGAVGKANAEVVRIWEPAAFVVASITAGRWTVEEMMAPWALVEVIIVGRDAETEAVERLVKRTVLPCALVELMMTGWTTAVLVEMVMLPFESVEVTGIKTATGVVGRAAAGDGEGLTTMLLDAGAARLVTIGSSSFADTRAAGEGATGRSSLADSRAIGAL